jgi:hypothetical protein
LSVVALVVAHLSVVALVVAHLSVVALVVAHLSVFACKLLQNVLNMLMYVKFF